MSELSETLAKLDAEMTAGPWFHNGLQTDDLSDDYRLANAIFNTDGGGDPIPHEKELKLLRRPEPGEPKEADAETSNANIRAITTLRNLLPTLIAAENERERLREALRPFAEIQPTADSSDSVMVESIHILRARAALRASE